jgi:hypothetical protein
MCFDSGDVSRLNPFKEGFEKANYPTWEYDIMISFPENNLESIVSNMNYLDFHKSQTILCNVNLALYMVNLTSSYWHSLLLLWVFKSAMQ